MPRRIAKPGQQLQPTFIKHWRKFRGLSQDRLVSRVAELVPSFSKASLSRIENSLQPYSQPILEAVATSLNCRPADLIMRNPLDTEAPWSIWERLKPEQRRQAIAILKTLAGEDAPDIAA
jgi:transcriptional regulator with XRE-family HTH domain